MPKLDAKDCAAIVTGHSRGLGEAIAVELLARGMRVLGIARHDNAVLGAKFPVLLQQVKLDLGDADALTRWLGAKSFARFTEVARVALLVNNAGLLQPIGPPETQEVDAIARAVAVNVAAPLMLSAAFAQARGRRAGRILHVSSGAGRKAYAGWSIYCATKAALDHHARCVALDASPGLSISSLAPGVIDTDMQAEIRASTDERFPDRPRFVAMHRDHTLPSATERAEAIVEYLMSDVFGNEPVFDLRDFQRSSSGARS